MLWMVSLIAVMACLVSAPAFADQPRNFLVVKPGIYTPTSSDMEDFGSGFSGEISYGRYFNPHFAGEVGVGYFKVEGDFTGSLLGLLVSEKDEITVHPVTFTAKGVIPFQRGEIYFGGGMGLYFAEVESDIGNAGLGHETHTSRDTALGTHVVGGGNFNFTPNLYIGGELKYIVARATFDETFFDFPLTMHAHLDGLITTVNIGCRF